MSITLRPEHEEVIAHAVESGAYASPDEVIERALQLLRAEDTWIEEHKPEIAEKIDRAFDQFDRGQFFTSDQSRSDMEKRKAEWLAGRQR